VPRRMTQQPLTFTVRRCENGEIYALSTPSVLRQSECGELRRAWARYVDKGATRLMLVDGMHLHEEAPRSSRG